MFAENSQISGRQAFRLLSYDLLGTGTLLLPQLLAARTGQDGIFTIVTVIGQQFMAAGTDIQVLFIVFVQQIRKLPVMDMGQHLLHRPGGHFTPRIAFP